jgi:hypothetical protein
MRRMAGPRLAGCYSCGRLSEIHLSLSSAIAQAAWLTSLVPCVQVIL